MLSKQNIDCNKIKEHREKFKPGEESHEYLFIRDWPTGSIRLEFFNEYKVGGDRLLLKRTRRESEIGIVFNSVEAEKIALVFRKQYASSQEEKYVKGDCDENQIEHGQGIYKDWRFEPIDEITEKDPHRRICFKLMYSPSINGEWYFLCEEILDYHNTEKWIRKRGGGVEISGNLLEEIAESLEDCVICMKKQHTA